MSRYYGIMASATTEFHAMRNYEQKVGAYRMLSTISDQLWQMHFEDRLRLSAKDIIVTLDSIKSNLLEDLIHSEPPVVRVSLPSPPLSQ
jgi:hypothetical protein